MLPQEVIHTTVVLEVLRQEVAAIIEALHLDRAIDLQEVVAVEVIEAVQAHQDLLQVVQGHLGDLQEEDNKPCSKIYKT